MGNAELLEPIERHRSPINLPPPDAVDLGPAPRPTAATRAGADRRHRPRAEQHRAGLNCWPWPRQVGGMCLTDEGGDVTFRHHKVEGVVTEPCAEA